MRRKKHSVDVLFMFVLFAVFAILSVMIIYIGSGVYNAISEEKKDNETERTTLSYIVNKVRNSSGEVFVQENSDGVKILTIKYGEDDDAIETLIYEYAGKLMEMTVIAGTSIDLQFGDRLIEASGIDFEMDEDRNILRISMDTGDGEKSCASVYLGTDAVNTLTQ